MAGRKKTLSPVPSRWLAAKNRFLLHEAVRSPHRLVFFGTQSWVPCTHLWVPCADLFPSVLNRWLPSQIIFFCAELRVSCFESFSFVQSRSLPENIFFLPIQFAGSSTDPLVPRID
jgi:hypothetical protein